MIICLNFSCPNAPQNIAAASGKKQGPATDGGGGAGGGGKESVPPPRKLVRGQDVWLGKGEEQES